MQREVADRHGVDRSTVVSACRTANQGALDALAAAVHGRRGQSPQDAQLATAKDELERVGATVTEQAVALHLHEGQRVGTDHRPGPAAGGRTRQGRLLDLIDHAAERGWSTRRAAGLLGLEEVRAGRWQQRRATGALDDRAPGALHGTRCGFRFSPPTMLLTVPPQRQANNLLTPDPRWGIR